MTPLLKSGRLRNDYDLCPLCGQPKKIAAATCRRCSVEPIESRFWRQVDGGGDGCWLWTGAGAGKGYGGFWVDATRGHQPAHRIAYELAVGPIPTGMHIDHLCRNRRCVNPVHLEPVTPRENVLRGERAQPRIAA